MNKKTVVILDTNILISAILFKGTPLRVLEHCISEEKTDAAISPELLAELIGKLKYKFGIKNKTLEELKDFMENSFLNLMPDYRTEICRDDSDNKTIDLAIWANGGFIVTGDNDLFELGDYKGIKIITAAQFLEKFKEQS